MFESTSFPQAGDLFAGKYLIERILGTGHMSVVFGARHHITGKSLAVRWLYPDPNATEQTPTPNGSARAGRPQVIGHFQHKNILEVIDVDHASGSNYMVMEWPDGESLKARLARVGPLSVADARRLLVPCMRGMNEAHQAGIEHLDLKPANILISQGSEFTDEIARVLDFEVADRWTSSSPQMPAPEIASPYYRAPEQLGGLEVDLRADVYAFGAILHEALTGRPPFAPTPLGSQNYGIVTARSLAAHTTAQPLPPGADFVVGRAMAREPSARFQSLAELADAFDAYVAAPRGTFMTRTRPHIDNFPMHGHFSPDMYEDTPSDLRSAPPAYGRPMPRPAFESRVYVMLGLLVVAVGASIGWYRASKRADVVATYEYVAEPGVAVVELDEQSASERTPPPSPAAPGAASPVAQGDEASPRDPAGEIPLPVWRFPTPQLGATPPPAVPQPLVVSPQLGAMPPLGASPQRGAATQRRAKPSPPLGRVSPALVAPQPRAPAVPVPSRPPAPPAKRSVLKELPDMDLM